MSNASSSSSSGSPRRSDLATLFLVLVAFIVLGTSAPGRALGAGPTGGEGIGTGLRLIMVDDIGCQYCRKWDVEVGGIYERSPVGAVAPLERRAKRHPDLAPYEPLAYTPTFILVRDGREVGRIVGYPGADFFWAELERLIAKAGPIVPHTIPDGVVSPRDTSIRRQDHGTTPPGALPIVAKH